MRLIALLTSAAVAVTAPQNAAHAYPIDCAILLCLAGGFPPSAECTAAKVEFIRRITPWPIEPPLQLWRCPMGFDAKTAASLGITPPALGPDGMTPEVRAYRDGIEVIHIQSYSRTRERDTPNDAIYETVNVGRYAVDGSFAWGRGSYVSGPEWLAEATGGVRKGVYERYGREDQYERLIGYENYLLGSLRGVAMRYRDYTGAYHTEFVRY